MAGLSILKKLLMKQAMKESAPFQHEGIMSISKTLSSNIDAKVKRWAESAKRQGQDLDKMSEQELKYLIELNKPRAPTVLSNEEAYEFLNKFLNQNKKGKVIKADFGKPFAEEVVTVESVIADIKKLDPIESMKETNKVLKGEGRYKSLSKADREKIAGDESVTDHIFERNIIDETEDFAQGGRTGLSYLLAEDTNERMPMWLGGGLSKGKRTLSELLKYMSKGSSHKRSPSKMLQMMNPKQFNEMLDRPQGIPSLAKEMIEDYIKEMKIDRADMVEHLIRTGRSIKNVDDDIAKYKMKIIEDMVSKGADRATAEKMAETILIMVKQGAEKKATPKITDQGLLEMENIQKNLATKDRPLNAEGGRIGFGLGGFNAARRAFLKAMGAGAATVGAAKSGLFGLLKGGGKKEVIETLTEVPIKNIEGMPAWFKPLVNKVIKEGKAEKITEYDRLITHTTKLPDSKTPISVSQDLNTGDVWVDIGMGKHGFPDGHYGQPVRLEYKAAEVIEPQHQGLPEGWFGDRKTGQKTGPGTKTKEEFWVEEAEFTGGHPENVKFEESTIEKFGDHGSNFDEVEMFATGKVKKSKPTKKRSQTEWEQEKAQADAEAYWEEHGDYASGGIAKMLGE